MAMLNVTYAVAQGITRNLKEHEDSLNGCPFLLEKTWT